MTPIEYFRQTLNHLLVELDEWFNESSKPYMDVMHVIPDLMISAHYTNFDWRSPTERFAKKFTDDMPCSGSLKSELESGVPIGSKHSVESSLTQ